jgi:hypothetical protein
MWSWLTVKQPSRENLNVEVELKYKNHPRRRRLPGPGLVVRLVACFLSSKLARSREVKGDRYVTCERRQT